MSKDLAEFWTRHGIVARLEYSAFRSGRASAPSRYRHPPKQIAAPAPPGGFTGLAKSTRMLRESTASDRQHQMMLLTSGLSIRVERVTQHRTFLGNVMGPSKRRCTLRTPRSRPPLVPAGISPRLCSSAFCLRPTHIFQANLLRFTFPSFTSRSSIVPLLIDCVAVVDVSK
jgi:hypothetical protein